MPHMKKTYRLPGRTEYEIGYCGKYGRAGEKRGKRKKLTPEQMKRQNQKNKENRIRRLIAANFTEGDYFCTLKFPQGTRLPIEAVKKEFNNFKRRLQTAYKKFKEELKYIYRIEVGTLGGIHIHVIINRIKGVDTDLIIQDKWKAGRVNFQTIYEYGGYGALAIYITKVPTEGSEDYEQLSLFEMEEQKKLITVNSSRNLVRVEPEVTLYTRRTVHKLVTEGPTPTEGYYIDTDSIVTGVNPYTGMSYYHYAEVKIKKRREDNVYQRFQNQKTG